MSGNVNEENNFELDTPGTGPTSSHRPSPPFEDSHLPDSPEALSSTSATATLELIWWVTRHCSVIKVVPQPNTNTGPVNPNWKTDPDLNILTFCGLARSDAVLGGARISHIQARKSSRPPFLHEYLLVFFTTSNNDRFVTRIDRLGKVMSMPRARSQHVPHPTTSAAIHGVKVYQIQNPLNGINSPDGPWLAADMGWGSHPVATLATWESVRTSETQVSHHINSRGMSGAHPEMKDVSELLEAILLEMPNYHLTTANCYFMTRSSLILLQHCYPSAFACFLGTTTEQIVHPSDLAQPVWTGLLRWYLPFVTLFLISYVILLTVVHQQVLRLVGCPIRWDDRSEISCRPSNQAIGVVFALHAVLDAPLPIGLLHGYMTSLEVEMNKLIGSLTTRFSDTRAEPSPEAMPQRPFGVLFQAAWRTILTWCLLGCAAGAFMLASMAFEYGNLIVFVLLLIECITLDMRIGTERSGPLPDQKAINDLFGEATPA